MTSPKRINLGLAILVGIGCCGLLLNSVYSQSAPKAGSDVKGASRAPSTGSLAAPPGVPTAPTTPAAGGPPGAIPGMGGFGGRLGAGGGMPGMSGGMGPGAYGTVGSPNQAELQLAEQVRQLLRIYVAEANPEAKANLKRDLSATLSTQFDLQHNRRDEELKKIEQRLADLRAKLTRRAEAKPTIVDRRLEQLISDVEGLGWGPDDVSQDLLEFGATSGGPPAMPMGSGARAGSMMMPGGGAGMPGGMAPGFAPPSNYNGTPTRRPATAPAQATPAIPGTSVPPKNVPMIAVPGSDPFGPANLTPPGTPATIPLANTPVPPKATKPIPAAPGAGAGDPAPDLNPPVTTPDPKPVDVPMFDE